MPRSKPSWQLPAGVSRGTWDYINSGHIASQYDEYILDNPLLKLDLDLTLSLVQEIQQSRVSRSLPPIRVADLGCGTGRVAHCLLPLGCEMLNIDLSPGMLKALEEKIPAEYADRNQCLQASLVDLEQTLPGESLDLAVCLFSSLGMIRGRQHRRKCLTGTKQALRPGGKFLLHVHNRYRSLWDPGGLRWLTSTYLASLRKTDVEFGDRVYAYRGLPKMFLHIYSHRELTQDLQQAGFRDIQILNIADAGDRLLKHRTFAPGLRAGGFFAIAHA